MSIHWITWVWDESPLRETKLLVHLALADIAHHDGRFFASQKQIAEMARCSVKYVSMVVRDMEEQGLIVVLEKGNGRGKATVYQLLGRQSKRANNDPPFTDQERGNYGPERGNYAAERGNSTPNHSSYTPVLTTRPKRTGSAVAKPTVTEPAFDEFWKVYPRKVAKGHAVRAWAQAVKKAPPTVIITGAVRYRDDPNREDKFTAHPATWLNGERWNDDPLPESGTRSERKASEVGDMISRAAARDAERERRAIS